MGKENMKEVYTMEKWKILSLKKEGTLVTWNNIDELGGHYVM